MTTNTPLRDVHELANMLIAALSDAKHSDEVDPHTREANDYLEIALMNYKVMMRRRVLTSCYEFLTPPGAQERAGWYWRHPKHDHRDYVNWHGPFPSRKEAIKDRLGQRGAPRTPLDVIEREIFGS